MTTQTESLEDTLTYLIRKLRRGTFDKQDAVILAVEAARAYYENTQDESLCNALEKTKAVRELWGEET